MWQAQQSGTEHGLAWRCSTRGSLSLPHKHWPRPLRALSPRRVLPHGPLPRERAPGKHGLHLSGAVWGRRIQRELQRRAACGRKRGARLPAFGNTPGPDGNPSEPPGTLCHTTPVSERCPFPMPPRGSLPPPPTQDTHHQTPPRPETSTKCQPMAAGEKPARQGYTRREQSREMRMGQFTAQKRATWEVPHTPSHLQAVASQV